MATFQAVLASESLLSCVIAFQRGLDGRIADIHRQMTSHEPLTEKPPNVALEVLGSIWFTQDEALLNDCPLEIVQVLVENRAKLPLAKTMDLAAKRGRLDVMTFLHVHGLEGCTTKAVDGAAARGFTDVVDFLL
ncbi:hypothetical protein DYB28_008425 [Aphanomyces astaci]|uniref:Uncharacterized protein n=1 Tax=Aphanomyces astaci TaxID=112090 RepID=A0A9X8EC76_APHAT|nr:hypothetical protein DYB28_008425 [Aphanomyces astaci]